MIVIGVSPDFFYYYSDLYRLMPVYCFLEKEKENIEVYKEEETEVAKEEEIEVYKEEEKREEETVEKVVSNIIPDPKIDLAPEKLADYNYIMNQFFIVDGQTGVRKNLINAEKLMNENLKINQDAKILIYHSHSQEAFIDSRAGEIEDTIVGVGAYLKTILTEKYGYHVIHITEAFDVMENGQIDRSAAYDHAREYISEYLKKNPSVQVLIDLHRDGVPEDRICVTEINGKKTAQIMFFNGLSSFAQDGEISYLPNPYIAENLAFSFQMEYMAALYYPDFYRGIYLAPLRYNLHLRPRSMLLEAGAQNNTVQEVKNAMIPFADILNRVLKVGDK